MTSAIALAVLALATVAGRAATEDTAQESSFNQVKEADAAVRITNKVTYSPPMVIIGFDNGTIARCPVASPSSCEVYYTGNSLVTATAVHGEFLFASLQSGAMLRCIWRRTHSCFVFHQANSEMTSLAVTAGFAYAGLRNGTILKCEMHTPHSCESYASVGMDISAIAAFDSFIYVGVSNGGILRCTKRDCNYVNDRNGYSEIIGLVAIGKNIYGATSGSSLYKCDRITYKCGDRLTGVSGTNKGNAVYGNKIYTLLECGQISITDPLASDVSSSSQFVEHQGAASISFAYGTHAMLNKYRTESEKCIWSGFQCPPTVFYYEVQRRAALEVFVKNGLLYDSQGGLVDTSNADESNSQKAAIFVMGPDGQILLSNIHKPGLLHTSSLLAGHPVSGAGLMVVDQGKIRSITACSAHYTPDRELNNQVIESLYLKGYTDRIDSHPCIYSDINCAQACSNIN